MSAVENTDAVPRTMKKSPMSRGISDIKPDTLDLISKGLFFFDGLNSASQDVQVFSPGFISMRTIRPAQSQQVHSRAMAKFFTATLTALALGATILAAAADPICDTTVNQDSGIIDLTTGDKVS